MAIRSLTMGAAVAVAVATSALAASVTGIPAIKRGTPYSEARTSLQALGFEPVHLANADKCYDGDVRCEGHPEMYRCSGTGLARCTFLWKRNDTLIEVGTSGETRPAIDEVRCRANCR